MRKSIHISFFIENSHESSLEDRAISLLKMFDEVFPSRLVSCAYFVTNRNYNTHFFSLISMHSLKKHKSTAHCRKVPLKKHQSPAEKLRIEQRIINKFDLKDFSIQLEDISQLLLIHVA